jgi:acetylornithine aminotransferase
VSDEILVASAFLRDPRVQEARRLLAEAALEHRGALQSVRPAQAALATRYAEALEQFAELRGGALFYPYLGSGLGNGALVELADGSVKFDMICGIGVHYFGHGAPETSERLLDAALGDTVMQGNLQQNVESAELVDAFIRLANRGGANLEHCFLTTSGAMANENALKLALNQHRPADRVLAFAGAFAGRTLAMSQITDNPAYRAGLPLALAVDYVPFFRPEDPAGSTDAAVAALRSHLMRHPGRHGAMILELVQGEGGYHPGDTAFFEAILNVLREHDVAIWFDEIQTFGRTFAPFAFQHFGLDAYADIVTVGKTSQVCSTLFGARYRPPPGLISQTFTGASSSIAVGRYVVERFEDGDLFGDQGRVAEVSQRFIAGFEAIRARHSDWLRGPYGLGAMLAFTPFEGGRETTRALLDDLFQHGVIAFSTGGPLARLRFLPPVGVIRDDEIDAVLAILEASLGRVAARSA